MATGTQMVLEVKKNKLNNSSKNALRLFILFFKFRIWTIIKHQSYGSVVNMIDDICMGNIKIPMLSNKNKLNEIDNMVLESNKLRYIAYNKEQEAINIMNKEVLGL